MDTRRILTNQSAPEILLYNRQKVVVRKERNDTILRCKVLYAVG